jgi:hypothetical protein
MKARSTTPKYGIYYFIYDYICNLWHQWLGDYVGKSDV